MHQYIAMSQDTAPEPSEEQSEQLFQKFDHWAQVNGYGEDDVNHDIATTSDGDGSDEKGSDGDVASAFNSCSICHLF